MVCTGSAVRTALARVVRLAKVSVLAFELLSLVESLAIMCSKSECLGLEGIKAKPKYLPSLGVTKICKMLQIFSRVLVSQLGEKKILDLFSLMVRPLCWEKSCRIVWIVVALVGVASAKRKTSSANKVREMTGLEGVMGIGDQLQIETCLWMSVERNSMPKMNK